MWTSRNLQLPFLFNPAQHDREPTRITQVTLTAKGEPFARNAAQRAMLTDLWLTTEGALPGTNPLQEKGSWYTVDAAASKLTDINRQRIFRDKIFLFNVIFGLEWVPSDRTKQQIRIAAKRASDLLYDVTDGYMAIGQVIIGGPELLEACDIQVLASNRLYPRSWVDALNESAKFQPIRLGCGMWQKNRGILLTWDTPEGYRAIVHEWGHYAFGMADAYLRKRKYARANVAQPLWDDTKPNSTIVAVAVPEIALPVETIMANQEISEYAPIDQVFDRISQRFGEKITQSKSLDGPVELPMPLPIFPQAKPVASAADLGSALPTDKPGQEMLLPVDGFISLVQSDPAVQQLARASKEAMPLNQDLQGPPSKTHSHWLYLLKGQFNNVDDIPTRIIAQGKISDDDEDRGFTLLGAEAGDRVAIVSEVGGYGRVHCGVLEPISRGGTPSLVVSKWHPVTPTDGTQTIGGYPFFVDVIPKSLGAIEWEQTPSLVEVAVSVTAKNPPDEAYVYASGQADGINMDLPTPAAGAPDFAPVISAYKSVAHLDGHVFLRWQAKDDTPGKFFICSFSQGGGPATTAGGKPSITAGSSEGNAMLFFLGSNVVGAEGDAVPNESPTVRIVTSVLPAMQPLSPDAVLESRSYIFSLASNEPLTQYTATLVLYYDHGAPKYGGDLFVYRWNEGSGSWQRQTTIAPTDLAYIALPIKDGLETAPNLMSATGTHVERYRICWQQRPSDTQPKDRSNAGQE